MRTKLEHSPSILVVEDSRLARQSYCQHLAQNRFRILEAANVKEALQAISEFELDVVVVDLNLPDGDGITLIKNIREQSNKHEFLQFILISASVSLHNAVDALRLTVRAILTKPFGPDQLLDSVRLAATHAKDIKDKKARDAATLATLKEVKLSADNAVELALKSCSKDVIDNYQDPSSRFSETPQSLTGLKSELSRLKSLSRVFGEPISHSQWAMLLIIYEAHLLGSSITVKGISAATGIPLSTALRKTGEMESDDLIVRRSDPNDARRSFLSLSQNGLNKLRNYFLVQYQEKGRERCTA